LSIRLPLFSQVVHEAEGSKRKNVRSSMREVATKANPVKAGDAKPRG
jgi:hypothetical protein